MKPPDDRRQNRRDLCAELIQVAWSDSEQHRISRLGLLEDVSPGGVCVILELPVPVGVTVYLHTPGFSSKAQVRYCKPDEGGYRVGLEFEEDGAWDRRKWKPGHLLELGTAPD